MLRYAPEKKIRILPVKLADVYPPEPPGRAGRQQNASILKEPRRQRPHGDSPKKKIGTERGMVCDPLTTKTEDAGVVKQVQRRFPWKSRLFGYHGESLVTNLQSILIM